MTAQTIARRPAAAPPATSRARVLGYAMTGAVGAVMIAGLRLVLPYHETDSTSAMLAKVAAHPDRQRLVLVLGALGVVLLIPGYQALARLTQGDAARLTGAALTLSYVGYLALAMTLLSDQLLLSARSTGSQPAVTDLVQQVASSPYLVVVTVVFVVGHILGTVLLGVAFLRTRTIPRWAAVVVLVSQPLHFVAAIILNNRVLDFACWMAMAVGFAAAGTVLVRSTPREDAR